MPKEIQCCRICGETSLEPILELGDQYLTGVFPRTPDQEVTCGPLELVKCHGVDSCGLLQLRHSYDSAEMYGANYGYRSGLNRSMVEHLQHKVASLLRSVNLSNSDLVLDVGSNDGTLLSFYPATITRVGMDPTSAKFLHHYQPGIEVISDFFSADAFFRRFGDRKAKIVTSIAMFYDLDDPLSFVEQVAEILADDGIWHFEQSYLPSMLTTNAYDTVCHEHLEYYSLKQIKWMTDRCGLKIVDVSLNDINGGSFGVTVTKAGSPLAANDSAVQRILADEDRAGISTLEPYARFREHVFKHRDQLLSLLDRLHTEGAKVLGYGASTKGNVILQFCGITAEQIPCIGEVNPDKFGSFTPGTNIPIVSEDEMHMMKPDYLLVLPWHFRQNILTREDAYLRQGGKMIFPLPEIKIFP
jgi:hypothetical protein